MLRVIEVGPRDGLQNEDTPISTEDKLAFIIGLAKAGLKEIEATSFVSPKWVPQLADSTDLWPQLPHGPLYSALVPNRRGLETAMNLGVDRIALFTGATDGFVRKNINSTVEESLALFAELVTEFRSRTPGGWVRGYLSVVFECPYDGRVSPKKVAELTERLIEMGCDEVSLGDTIGAAGPGEVQDLISFIKGRAPDEKVAWHFHDTRGRALLNAWTAWQEGYRAFDTSAAGMGGCPYAMGSAGNLATEDLILLLEREGIKTGIDLDLLAEASRPLRELLGLAPRSKALQALEAV
jgi:hydroxymethylglutaryl-CoA lyase